MAGMSLGPTAGFWGKLGNKFKSAMPGALNAMAQNYGPDYMKPMARVTGGMQKAPVPTEKQMKGEGKTGNRGNMLDMTSMVRPYGGFNFGMNQLPIMSAQPVQEPGNMGGMMGPRNMGNIGGLWNSYNRLSGIGPTSESVPRRGLFF